MKQIFFKSNKGVLGGSLISAVFSVLPDSPVSDDWLLWRSISCAIRRYELNFYYHSKFTKSNNKEQLLSHTILPSVLKLEALYRQEKGLLVQR